MPKTFIRNLLMRLRRVQEAIRREERHLAPDGLRLSRLKKLRLALKDRIYAISDASLRQRRAGRSSSVA